jgi:hypothetical protein
MSTAKSWRSSRWRDFRIVVSSACGLSRHPAWRIPGTADARERIARVRSEKWSEQDLLELVRLLQKFATDIDEVAQGPKFP